MSDISEISGELDKTSDQGTKTPPNMNKKNGKKGKSSVPSCGACKAEIEAEEKQVICEICGINYHAKCQDITSRQYSVIINQNTNLHWFCKFCDRGTSKVLAQLSSIVREQETIKDDLNDLQATNKLIYDELKDIKANLEERSKKDEEVDKKLTKLSSEVSNFNDRMNETHLSYGDNFKRPSPAVQRAHIDLVAWENDRLEQYGRRSNMRVYGIPETQGESTTQIVLDLANRLGSPLTVHDICTSHRLGYHRRPREGEDSAPPRPIIVRFTRRDAKISMMRQRRKLAGGRQDQQNNGDYRPNIYLNDDLTSLRSKMRYILSKESDMEHVNTINGRLLCTKKVNGKDIVITIDTPADLMRKLRWEYQRLEYEGLVTSVDDELLGYYQNYYGELNE